MPEHPVVELLQTPAFVLDESAVELFDLEAAHEVAHGDGGAHRVPIDVALRAPFGEAHVLHQVLDGAVVAELTGLETDVD